MIDPLDQLLSEAKHHAYLQREKASRGRVSSPKIPIRHQADYSDWRVGGTVTLIHRNPETGEETSLGSFVEHTRAHTRWLRPTADTLTPGAQEIVTGSWWINPHIREIPQDTTEEILAIRSRFEELLAMYPEEQAPGQIPDRPLNPPDFDDKDPLFDNEDEDLQDEVDEEDDEDFDDEDDEDEDDEDKE